MICIQITAPLFVPRFFGPGVNLAELKPVLASSQRLATEHVSRMVDASLSTQWASATGDVAPWAWVDLLGVYNVPWAIGRCVDVGVSWCVLFWGDMLRFQRSFGAPNFLVDVGGCFFF